MTKIISFFNHKGGVGKTTLVYNLAWYIAEYHKKKVLLIDADSQQNLSSFVLGFNTDNNDKGLFSPDDFDDFEKSITLYEFLTPKLFPLAFDEVEKNLYNKALPSGRNLSIMRGSIKTAEFDYDFSGMEERDNKAKSHIPKTLLKALKQVGKEYDYIFIDMSPNLGVFNKTLLMCSDYFITPASPTFFSVQAIENLCSIIVKWNEDFSIFRKSQYDKDGITAKPKFLGVISQNFRPRETNRNKDNTEAMARGFNKWHTDLKNAAILLANRLGDYQMSLKEDEFKNTFNNKTPYLITDISDLNQVARISEEYGKPIFAFSLNELTTEGLNQPHYKKQIEDLKTSLQTITDGLIKFL